MEIVGLNSENLLYHRTNFGKHSDSKFPRLYVSLILYFIFFLPKIIWDINRKTRSIAKKMLHNQCIDSEMYNEILNRTNT